MTSLSDVKQDRAAQLLAGPRGRHVCAEVGMVTDPTVDWPFDATDRLTVNIFVDQLGVIDAARVAALTDPLDLMAPLRASVDSAMYWQEPDDRDALLGDPRVVAALDPVAQALAVAPAAHWWWSPLDLRQQAIVRWMEQGQRRATRPQLTGTFERLERWRRDTVAAEAQAAREWPTAHDANYSGSWWSTPVHVNVNTTSRRINRLPAVQLDLVEDSSGWDHARVATVEIHPSRRVFEIAAPSDWIDLVDRYPLDVDRSRRHDWWRATGGAGPWQIPAWPAVSQDYDAVHLTVIGYLSAAGRPLQTRSGQTVLAGFDPDVTYWLTDSITRTAPPTTWRRPESADYARVGPRHNRPVEPSPSRGLRAPSRCRTGRRPRCGPAHPRDGASWTANSDSGRSLQGRPIPLDRRTAQPRSTRRGDRHPSLS